MDGTVCYTNAELRWTDSGQILTSNELQVPSMSYCFGESNADELDRGRCRPRPKGGQYVLPSS
jgi:hypothetical protein